MKKLLSSFLIILFGLVTLLGTFIAHAKAATIYVPDDYATIQAAIDNTSDGDVVVVKSGIYIENIDFKGRAITVKSTNPENSNIVANTIIDGNEAGSVVTFNTREKNDSILDGITIMNGRANWGGGIYCFESSPKIKNCIISDNETNSSYYQDYGGAGIYCEYSSAIITNCRIYNNYARFCGDGAIYFKNSSAAVIEDCVINDNSVGDSGGGISISSSSSILITNCKIENNYAEYFGGGVFCRYSSGAITNCMIKGNTANSCEGGGIACLGFSLDITNCIISSNSATLTGIHGHGGGGIGFLNHSSASVVNCIISNNIAHKGGGICCRDQASPFITNCTITQNSAVAQGGGINCRDSSPTITNCISWNDSPDEIYVISLYGTPIITYSDIQGGYTGTGNINAEPQFVNSVEEDYRLQSTSPCIDIGLAGIGIPTHDIDGNLRDENPDMGAYENTIADIDEDGVLDEDDNCPDIANSDQADLDGDGAGDVCDLDDDNDGIEDEIDNCSEIFNPDQADLDEDGTGDVCDLDRDGDGISNDIDNCPNENSSEQDSDEDGCIDTIDNMPQLIKNLNLPKGNENSLITLINNVQKSIAKGNIPTAINQLEAFIKKVTAQSGKKIPEEDAEMLIQYAINLINSL